MNHYVTFVHSFYERLEEYPLSSSAITLWHALVFIFQRDYSEEDEFSISLSALCNKTSLSTRTVTSARNELKQSGYIDFKTIGGNKSALYNVIVFEGNDCLQEKSAYNNAGNEYLQEKNAHNGAGNECLQANNAHKDAGNNCLQANNAHNGAGNNCLQANNAHNGAGNNYLQEKNAHKDARNDCLQANNTDHFTVITKEKNKQQKEYKEQHNNRSYYETVCNAFYFYEQNIGKLNHDVKKEIGDWVEKFGHESVVEAIKISLLKHKKTFHYTRGILKNWDKKKKDQQKEAFKVPSSVRVSKMPKCMDKAFEQTKGIDKSQFEKKRQELEERIKRMNAS